MNSEHMLEMNLGISMSLDFGMNCSLWFQFCRMRAIFSQHHIRLLRTGKVSHYSLKFDLITSPKIIWPVLKQTETTGR
jgi:hypothetical protein